MVVQELVACDAQGEEAFADSLEAVQEIAQAGPQAFHRVTVHTHAVRVMPSIFAGTMVDRPMVIVGRGKVADVVLISEELCPALHLGRDNGFDGRGAYILQDFQIHLRRWRVRIGLVAALDQAKNGWTARRGGGATAQLQPARSW